MTGRPGAPENLKVASSTENSVVLRWSPPSTDGGCSIKQYIVEKRDTSRRTYTTIGTTAGTDMKVTRLVPGNEYEFVVSAENDAGVGPTATVIHGLSAISKCK